MQSLQVETGPGAVDERGLMEARQAKREAREARLVRERAQAETRRREVCQQVAASVRNSPVQALPCLDPFMKRARSTLNAGATDTPSEATERAIFTHILETLTDYDGLMRMLNRLEAGFELSAALRIYVCCRVIRHYRLGLDPLEVAFPSGGRALLPAALRSGDPEAVAAAIIGVAP